MKENINYRKVYIKGISDLPKEEGEYFCNRSGFLSVQHLMTTLGNSYMREIRWYLQPLPEQESKSAEEWLNNRSDYNAIEGAFNIEWLAKLLNEFHAQFQQVEMPIRDILLAYVNYTDFDIKDVIDDEWLVDRFLNSIKSKIK